MKAMVCEVCGGNEVVKEGEYFVCKYCGTKYTTEAARKLLIEFDNPVEVSGVVAVKNIANISNLFERAKYCLEEGNIAEAKQYVNKVLDLDPRNENALKEMKIIDEYNRLKNEYLLIPNIEVVAKPNPLLLLIGIVCAVLFFILLYLESYYSLFALPMMFICLISFGTKQAKYFGNEEQLHADNLRKESIKREMMSLLEESKRLFI